MPFRAETLTLFSDSGLIPVIFIKVLPAKIGATVFFMVALTTLMNERVAIGSNIPERGAGMVRHAVDAFGQTIAMVTHDAVDALTLATKGLVVDGGVTLKFA